MTHIYYSGVRSLALFTSLSLVTLLAACGTPDGGYYDANGNYMPTDTPHNMKKSSHSPLPGGTRYYHSDRTYNNAGYNDNYSEHPYYTHRGYYDYNGYYIARDNSLTVPQDMFPPRGMCRVWFADRALSNQPDIESCNDIRARLPNGAYVIYGG